MAANVMERIANRYSKWRSKKLRARRLEAWFKFGQSNPAGYDVGTTIDWDGLDKPDPRVLELSRSSGHVKLPTRRGAPFGDLHILRHPAEDDNAGVGPSLNFGRMRVQLNPSIESLVIVNHAVGGTGFSDNDWNPGDPSYNALIADIDLMFDEHPEYEPTGMFFHQGENDALAGMSQTNYQNAKAAMVAGIRAHVNSRRPGAGDKMVFICGTMVESWIAADETNRRPIDLAQRNVQAYIPNSACVDLSDLTDLTDTIHFGATSLREMGDRYALTAQDMTVEPAYPEGVAPCWLKVINGKLVDLSGNGHFVYGSPSITKASNKQGCLKSLSTLNPYTASVVLNHKAYTKSLWVEPSAIPAGDGHFISGSRDNSHVNAAHFFAKRGFGHNGVWINESAIAAAMTVGQRTHFALTYNDVDEKFWLYINGALVSGYPVATGATALAEQQNVQIGGINNSTTGSISAHYDDTVILPYDASATEIAAMYNLDALELRTPDQKEPRIVFADFAPEVDKLWFHTTDKVLYQYEDGPGMWLSVEEHVLQLSYASSAAGAHYLSMAGYVSTAITVPKGWVAPFDLMVTGWTYNNQNSLTSWTYKLIKYDVSATSQDLNVHAYTMGTSLKRWSEFDVEAEYDVGDILGVLASNGTGTAQNESMTLVYRRRAS